MTLKKSQLSLKKWGRQKWRTSDGKPSKGKKRYLPDAAWNALSPAEKRATNRAKAKVTEKVSNLLDNLKKLLEKLQNIDDDQEKRLKISKSRCIRLQ